MGKTAVRVLVVLFLTAQIALLLPPAAHVSAYTPHPPIYISGNGNFTPANGVTGGNGTEGNPYIIEGWEIYTSSAAGVWIEGTDAYFVVRDAFIQGSGIGVDAIRLWSLRNGRIDNVTAYGGGKGVAVSSASDVVLSDNNISGIDRGVEIYVASNVTVSNNSLRNSNIGVSVLSSSVCTISGNNISGIIRREGIKVESSDRVAIINNSISSPAHYGVLLRTSTNGTLAGNDFLNDGISVSGTSLAHYNTHEIALNNTVNGKPVYQYRDCNAVALDGVPVGQLIAANCTNARFSRLDIDHTDVGIQMAFMRNVTLASNNLSYDGEGIIIEYSDGLSVLNNSILQSATGSRALDIIYSNNVEVIGNFILGSYYGTMIKDCTNVTVRANALSGGYSYGLNLISVSGGMISGNAATGNDEGISLWKGDNVTISGNNASANTGMGILLNEVSHVDVSSNTINGNEWGIGVASYNKLRYTTISDNNVSFNTYGVMTSNGVTAEQVTITGNNIYRNAYGTYLLGVVGLKFYRNRFINNTVQAYDVNGPENSWDNGCPDGGNYWSNYTGTDAIDCVTGSSGRDGLGDTPFVIDVDSVDNYPLMTPPPPNKPPGAPWPLGIDYWFLNGSKMNHLTKLSNFTLNWTHNDPDPGDSQTWFDIAISGQPDRVGLVWTQTRMSLANTTMYAGSSLVKCTDYYLSVRTKDWVAWGPYAELKFHTNCLPTNLNHVWPPDLMTLPPDTSQIVAWAVAVDNDPGDTINYTWEVASEPTFTLIVSGGTTANNYSDPFATTTGNTYYWHVKASDGWEETAYTSPWRFTAGTVINNPPLAPWPLSVDGISKNGTGMSHITKLTNFSLSWNHSDPDGNPQYQAELVVSAFPNRSSPLWTRPISGTANTTTFNGTLSSCGDYYFSARTRDWYDWGPWAEQKFHTNCVPSGLVNLAPPDGAYLPWTGSKTVWWSWAADGDGDIVTYSWQVAGDPVFASIVSSGTTVNNYSDPFSTLPSSAYYWHVKATDDWEATPWTATWHFNTSGPPSVNLLRPVGGEYWAGGSVQQLVWTANDTQTPLSRLVFYLNYTSGLSSGSIAGPIIGVTNYMWRLPGMDAADVKVNVTVIDEDQLKDWDESGYFTIDSTPPTMQSYSPTGWNVAVDSYVNVVFSEPVNGMQTQMGQSFGILDGVTGKWVAVIWVRIPSDTWPQEIRFVPTTPLRTCVDYGAYVNGTFFDRASWGLSNPASWTFHSVCLPTVRLATQLSGMDWTGGSMHDIAWSMGDEIDTQLRVYLNYSRNGGADGYPYVAYSGNKTVGTATYSWSLPLIDATAARLKLTVVDSSGLSSSALSGTFTIDSTSPSILASAPSNGSPGVKITDIIQIVFNESVVRQSAEQAFSISPNPDGITFTWTKTGMGKDVLSVGHKPLKSRTDYTVTFGTVLRDDSDPGNHPSVPLIIKFTTKPPPDVQPPVAKAVGKNQVLVGQPITLDGSQSIGNITKYLWTITDNQGRIVEVLAGKVVTHTFTKNGRYAVTLKVTDELLGLSAEDRLEIAVTSSSNAGLLIVLVGALLVSSALIGGTEMLRVPLLTFLFAAVNRRKFRGKEDGVGRGMVLGYIKVHPGDCYMDIKRNLELNAGTLTWHLMKLEKEGIVKSRIEATRKRYYPAKMPLPMEDGGELHEIEKRLLKVVTTDPGLPTKLLAEELGVSSQLALYHIRKLSQKGLLVLERRGLRLRVYPPRGRNA